MSNLRCGPNINYLASTWGPKVREHLDEVTTLRILVADDHDINPGAD